ncbi:hypothetical protein OIV83_005423 [Microbotryomycetes sp. JL201]|nr:hypothetical protein OIV83_005423 [Microbotryomycetes sp. JL201]
MGDSVKLSNAIISVISLTIVIPYIWNTQQTVLYRVDEKYSGAWRAFVAIPMILHVLLLSFGQVQAYLVRGDSIVGAKERHRWDLLPSARAANFVFLCLGTLIVLGMLSAALALSVFGVRINNAFQDLTAEVLAINDRLGGRYDDEAFSEILPEIQAMTDAGLQYSHFFLAFYATASFATFSLLTVNVGAIGLSRLVRRRARQHIISFSEGESAPLPTSSTRPCLNHMASFTTSMSGHSDLDVCLDKNDISQLSPKALQLLAERASHGLRGQQARKMLVLLKAERDLVITALWLATVSAAACGLAMWYTIALAAMNTWEDGFATQEAALLSLTWLYTCFLLLCQPYILRDSFRQYFSTKSYSRRRHAALYGTTDDSAFRTWLWRLKPGWSSRQRDNASSIKNSLAFSTLQTQKSRHVLAPSSMVRVVIEEKQFEEYRTDEMYEGVETRIEGGVFLQTGGRRTSDPDTIDLSAARRSSAASTKSISSDGLLKPPTAVHLRGGATGGLPLMPQEDASGRCPTRHIQWRRPDWTTAKNLNAPPVTVPTFRITRPGLVPRLEGQDAMTNIVSTLPETVLPGTEPSTPDMHGGSGPILTTSFSEAVPVEWLLGPPSPSSPPPRGGRKNSRAL